MTTQNVTITTGNPQFSKIFTDSSTDGVWSGNVLLDTIASQSIGILIPNSVLNWIQPEYESGCMAWRLQNAQTLRVSAYGFGAPTGVNEPSPLPYGPVRVNPNEILTSFPLASAGVGNHAALAWVTTTKGTELFFDATVADNTSTAITTAVNGQSLGDAFFNSTLTKICVQVQDGATLSEVELVDEMGGVVMTLQGAKRGAMAGAMSNIYNLEVDGLAVSIGKGWSLKVKGSSV